MISQSTATAEQGASEDYENAWIATRIATVQQGKSWSGGERNHLFLNVGGARFVDVSRLSNADCAGDGRAVALLDWDDDGKLDFLLKNRTAPRLQVFHNRFPADGRFLAVELRGNGKTVSRDAINARVFVEAGGRTFQRTLYGGEGFLAQSSKRLHFGLGDAQRVERLTVRWPDGTSSTHEDLPVDARFRLVQGGNGSSILPLEARPRSLDELPHAPAERIKKDEMRLVLAFELPLGPLPVPSFRDPQRRVADLAGKPVLLNLWREDCAPCLVELRAFGAALRERGDLGLRIVPLTLDGAGAEKDALERLGSLGMPAGDAGYLEPHSLAVWMGGIYEHVHPPRNNKSPATPTSFLVDAASNLVAIYHGPVELEQLLADVRELEREDPTPVLDRLRHGIRVVHHARDFQGLARAFEHLETIVGDEPVPVNGRDELAAFYRRMGETLPGYILRDGQRVAVRTGPPVSEE